MTLLHTVENKIPDNQSEAVLHDEKLLPPLLPFVSQK
jgi:hypothetical protein